MGNIFGDLVDHFGGQEATAQRLHVKQATVSGWVRGIHGMSPAVALRAERATEGAFTCQALCPSVFGSPSDSEAAADA